MIFERSLQRELAYTAGAVFMVLLTLVLTTMMIRIVGFAASGEIDPRDVLVLIGLTVIGYLAIIIRQEFMLFLVGGIFVIEACSVMLQVGYFKYTRKRFGTGQRLFLMAPIHHHFEKKNWHENQVVVRFYILCVLFAVVALSSLKIR